MASSLFGNNQQSPRQPMTPNNSPFELFGQIQQFAQSIQGKGDPEQLARQMAQQKGLNDGQLNQLFDKAKSIAGIFNGMGMHM